jgi:hypothetical protein
VHLYDLFGYGQPEAGATLRFGVGAIHLMELLEYARLMFRGDAACCSRASASSRLSSSMD